MALNIYLIGAIVLAIASSVYGSTCVQPEVSAKYFTTQDATIVSNIAYIAEFTLKCASPVSSNFPLYAEIDEKVFPAARIGDNKYQVSWTEEIKKARTGDHNVRLFDEEGYTSLRKALRSGEDPSAVRSLVKIVVSHPGAFTGPWVNSELLAAVLAIAVAYVALSSKSKLLS